jgi:hypothetical protein
MVITKDMVDYQSVEAHFETNNLYTFYPKSQKPIKAVTRHPPQNTPAEDIYDGPVDLDSDVISLKTSSKLPSLCYSSIKVGAYKSQNALTQCYNCQNFGPIRENCKQPPLCLWYEGSH